MIWAFIRATPARLWGYAVAALAVVGLMFGIRKSGVNAANRKHREQQRKADDETRKRIEKTKPAGSADDARDKLRKRKSD